MTNRVCWEAKKGLRTPRPVDNYDFGTYIHFYCLYEIQLNLPLSVISALWLMHPKKKAWISFCLGGNSFGERKPWSEPQSHERSSCPFLSILFSETFIFSLFNEIQQQANLGLDWVKNREEKSKPSRWYSNLLATHFIKNSFIMINHLLLAWESRYIPTKVNET